jgi:sec-independent protein translocase protein TatB
MNIFSNIGITELIVVLLIALLVVGPERLPEMGRKLAEILRDVRKAYENLTRDLGPELQSLQQTTQEIRESVDSVRSIPQDMFQTVVEAADLDDTIEELKGVTGSLEQVGQTVSAAGQVIKNPVGAAVDTAREALMPSKPEETEEGGQTAESEVEPAPATEAALASVDWARIDSSGMEEGTKPVEPREAEPAAATDAIPFSDDPALIETAEAEEAEEEAEETESNESDPTIGAPEEQTHE